MKSLLTPEKQLAELRDRIEALGSQRMAALERTLSEGREHGREAAAVMIRQGHGKELMDGIRALALAVVDGLRPAAEARGVKIALSANEEAAEVLGDPDRLALLRDWEPGCIISDIGMPGQDGYSFIREVRDLPPPLRTVPALALTAFARESDRDLALEAGFTDHLAKPVDTGALLQKVASLTRRV